MLQFEAVLRPQIAEALCRQLLAWGKVEELCAVEILGAGRRYEKGVSNLVVDTLPKVVLTGLIEDEDREELVDRICTRARIGRRGDGKIFFRAIEVIS